MLIKVKRTWKDYVENSNHKSFTRRDFLARGMATGVMSLAINKLLLGDIVKQAMAGTLTCPPPVTYPGAIAQIFAQGGPTMGARFISSAQATMVLNAGSGDSIAGNYGITGTAASLQTLGPNLVVDNLSPFGFTLLQGPPGYGGASLTAAQSAALWQSKVLSKVSGGGHLGPFNQDDGAGQNTGLIGGVSPFKQSQIGKDIQIGVSNTLASWASGLPSTSVSGNNLTPASMAKVFSLTPPASGLTSSVNLGQASDTANALGAALAPVLATPGRAGASLVTTNAGCAFYGNQVLANPTYGATLFNPTGITALTNNLTVSSLTNEEQAQLAGFYQSAAGVAGGVILEFGGRDYHGQSPQNVIAPADIEEARAIVMFLAACDAAQAPGAMIYMANGQAIANGTTAVTATINGANVNLNAPTAQGDAGGAYNAGLIIFYDPKGKPPAARFTGTVTASNGNAQIDSNVGSSVNAVGGLYLSALSWVGGGTISQAALSKMTSAGVSSSTSGIMVI